MNSYPFTAARVFNTPLLIHPVKGRVIAQALAAQFGITSVEINGIQPLAGAWSDDADFSEANEPDRGYDLVQGVALIDVSGTLVHRNGGLRPYSGLLGYDSLTRTWLNALADPSVKAIAAVCNSPGGEVSGCFDFADLIYRTRGEKPTLAILDDMAFSACYAIASACEQISVPRTGGTGSVGVVAMHADMSKRLTAEGIKVTIFQYGDRKADGSECIALSDEAREHFQADINEIGQLFDETVARNRNMTTAAVRATQAGTYLGAAGAEMGFADAVMAPDEAFRSLLATLS